MKKVLDFYVLATYISVMATEKQKIYIGASSQGASPEEKARIVSRTNHVCEILDAESYSYFADAGIKDVRVNKSSRGVTIPNEYFPADYLVTSLLGLRLDGDPKTLQYDIAMCNWVEDLFEQALGCIFVIERSNLGVGIELITALKIIQTQCLVLVGTDHISSLVNGQTSRLLTVCRYRDETVERDVKAFLRKVESGLDKDLRFLISAETDTWLRATAKELDFKGVPELVRHILNQARSKNSI